jgi:competence protein ComGC
MNGEKYRVIFKGEIAEGKILEDVKAKLSSELKLGRDKIEILFSKSAVVIKKGTQLETCEKIKKAFNRAGAICIIEKEKDVETEKKGPIPPPIPDGQISGSLMNEGRPVKKADERFCETCGAIVKINSLACPACGKQFKGKKSMPGCAIAAIIVAVVMFVIAILGILAAIAIPNFISYRNKALEASARMELTMVAAAEEQYYARYNVYTTDIEALEYEPARERITVRVVSADNECFEVVAELQGLGKDLRINCRNEIWETEKSPGDSYK